MEEQKISKLCAEADSGARRILYEEYSGRLYGICLRYASNRDEALDILHDAFIKIYTNIGKFSWRGPGSLGGWLSKVTVNVALERLRESAKYRTTEILPEMSGYPVPDEKDVGDIPMDLLIKFMEELPPGYRAVFNLYVFEELPHKEIARLLGINEKSSSSQLLRAKAAMANKINEYKNRLENGNQRK